MAPANVLAKSFTLSYWQTGVLDDAMTVGDGLTSEIGATEGDVQRPKPAVIPLYVPALRLGMITEPPAPELMVSAGWGMLFSE